METAKRIVCCRNDIVSEHFAINGTTNLDYVINKPMTPGCWKAVNYLLPLPGEYFCIEPWNPKCPVREIEEGNYFIGFQPVFIMQWIPLP